MGAALALLPDSKRAAIMWSARKFLVEKDGDGDYQQRGAELTADEYARLRRLCYGPLTQFTQVASVTSGGAVNSGTSVPPTDVNTTIATTLKEGITNDDINNITGGVTDPKERRALNEALTTLEAKQENATKDVLVRLKEATVTHERSKDDKELRKLSIAALQAFERRASTADTNDDGFRACEPLLATEYDHVTYAQA